MREKQLMNRDWRFYYGEPDYMRPSAAMSDQTYRWSRAQSARGPARRDFDDSGWERVDLPHDFVALHGVSETDAHGGEHYDFPMDRGSGWYRRYFTLDEQDRNKRILLHFEGMGTFCQVYVNSMLLKISRTNGIGFDVDITDAALFGSAQNVVSVHCDCRDFEAWYYEGGGITRNVYLVRTDRLSVETWGVFARAERIGEDAWRVDVDTEVRNDYPEGKTACARTRLRTRAGETAEEGVSEEIYIPSGETAVVTQSFVLHDPLLWSPETPNLYTAYTEVLCNGEEVDDCQTVFGVRELRYTPDHGLLVNGKKTTIHGFANHMLYLGVGEAMTDSMCEYQIRTLRDMGSNGYRTAHSPHQEAIMDWCDRYGQLVMDENRVFHSSDMGVDEVRRMVRRDRNHPSVCMWSLYNEEDLMTTDAGRRIFATLKREVKKLDPTRPVTGATSYGMFRGEGFEDFDLFGFNHQTMHFDALHALYPDKPIFCSEMIFPLGSKRDMPEAPVRWGEDARQLLKEYVVGGFHFTAWGYGPERPHIVGMEGTLTARYYAYMAYLKPDVPCARIGPGWDFPGREGQEVEVNLVNNGDRAELYVNGALAASAGTDPFSMTPVKVVYRPGTARLVAYKDGRVWAEDTAVTPGEAKKLELVCENREVTADGTDIAIVSAYVTDANGVRRLHDTGHLAEFEWENGDLVTTLSLRDDLYQGRVGPSIRFFDGKCQALIRPREGAKCVTVRVRSKGLEGASLTVPCVQAKTAQVPPCPGTYVNGWRVSGVYAGDMDDEKIIREHMTERWKKVDTLGTPSVLAGARRGHGKPGLYPDGVPLGYAYYVETTVPNVPGQGDMALHFEGIDGRAELYVTDGKKTDRATHGGDSPWFGHYRPEWIAACPSFREGDRVEIWVMMHDLGRINGIGWPVYWDRADKGKIEALEENTREEWERHKRQ